ncbi:FecR domain-containing protein [Patescibacteria group bacterium]|nr:FecR domain-containing protein [Patescibacteria group bacterium]
MKKLIKTIKTFGTITTIKDGFFDNSNLNSRKNRNNPKSLNQKGFSLIELIIVVVLIGVLSAVSFMAIQRTRARVMNEKVLDDMMAIYNALEDFQRDHQGVFPIPQTNSNQNILCYFSDATYAHDCDHELVAFRQGMIDNVLLTKRYLREVPTDPRTGSRYMYGATNDGKYFQVAGNYEREDGTYEARTTENIARGFHLPSLIRSFDGADFVIDKEAYLPYSPDYLVLTARLENVNGVVKVNGDPAVNGQVLRQDDVITTDLTGTADLYFSDGSVTYLAPGQNELILKQMKVDKNDADGTFTKILLRLKAGKIWSKVVRLASESEFRVETNGAIAGVRGTEFGVDADGNVKLKSGEVWTEGRVAGMDEEVPAEEIMDIPEPTDDNAYVPPTAPEYLTEEYENFYQVIQLNTGMQPHILSVNEGGIITVRNVNHFVDEVDYAVGFDRSIQVTHLAAYDAEEMDPETGEPILIISQPLVLASNGDPHVFQATAFLGHSVILRFEDHDDDDTLLHYSSFSEPPIQIEDNTELNEGEIYEEDIVEEVPMLTIIHSPFIPVGGTELLELGIEPPLDDVAYAVAVGDAGVCGVTPLAEGQFEISAVAVGDCVLTITATATMPDGMMEIPGETITIEVIEASANLLLISPYEGEELFTMEDTMPVNFVWEAPNAPADVTFTINVDGTEVPLGYVFSSEQILAASSHNWSVTMTGADDNTETKNSSFTITAIQAGGAVFTIHNSDPNGNQPDNGNLITFTDSVYLDVNVAAPDPNYTYQWSGSLPVTNMEGQSTTANVSGLIPNTPQPYTVILTVMNSDGAQVDQSSKQLTLTYEPKPTVGAIAFNPPPPTSVNQGSSFYDEIILNASVNVVIDQSSDPNAVGQPVKSDCKWYLDAIEVTDPVNTVFSPEGDHMVECKLFTAGFSNPDYILPADVTTGEVVVNVVQGAVCGNSIVEGGEVCDPPNTTTTESSCVSEGFPFGGNLFCNADCTAFDTTNCDTLETICLQNSGYWDGTDCWVLGATGQACGEYEDPQDPGNFLLGACEDAGLSCVVGDWNDEGCTICNALTGANNCAVDNIEPFAPYALGIFACRYRGISLPPNYCDISSGSEFRICKCE